MGCLDRLKAVQSRQWVVFAAMMCNLLITYLFGATSLIRSNGEISDLNRVLITPPGGAFSIWSIIFTIQIVFVLFQLFTESGREWSSPANWQTRYNPHLFVAFVVSQCLWALCFPFEKMLACAIFIFALWTALLAITVMFFCELKRRQRVAESARQQANNVKFDASAQQTRVQTSECAFFCWESVRLYVCWCLPFSLELGWISAAAPLNMMIVVAREHTHVEAQIGAGIVAACILAVTAGWRSIVERDVACAASIIWALSWIAARDPALPIRLGSNSSVVSPVITNGFKGAAESLVVLIAVFVAVGWILRFLWAWKLRAWLIAGDERTTAATVSAATSSGAGASADAGVISLQVPVNNHDSNGEKKEVPLI